mgnify:CR=1 FL=1
MRDEQLLAHCRKFHFEREKRADGIRCNQEEKEAVVSAKHRAMV